eukprot:gnl/TRDRNA2_/TRDRNA2_176349_c10_seq1.p1 gnl/TRDRNA2_/TRDRNA2_176349_c10~~gnl/TRDRNA2_/TRDRNA2_176349_c10_seq1.p1  ORF type:complete len:111 (-),score=23.96 gnl/TRDRNA2_/TRDRNA2_176349_c10_seq1:274-606(-)
MFFHILLDECDAEEVDIDAFAEGTMKMKGVANAMDMQTLMYKVNALHRLRQSDNEVVTYLFQNVSQHLEKLSELINRYPPVTATQQVLPKCKRPRHVGVQNSGTPTPTRL